jgi:hypothetical protein
MDTRTTLWSRYIMDPRSTLWSRYIMVPRSLFWNPPLLLSNSLLLLSNALKHLGLNAVANVMLAKSRGLSIILVDSCRLFNDAVAGGYTSHPSTVSLEDVERTGKGEISRVFKRHFRVHREEGL